MIELKINMKKIIILIVLTFTYSAISQSLSVFDVDASNFPTIKAKFFAFDKDGKQITNLNPSDFEVNENGQQRSVTNVSCPAPQPPVALSSVLIFDVSGSMSSGPPRIQSAKDAANAWIDGLPLGKSECALVSFNSYSNIVQDFTTSKDKLKVAIDKLTPNGGTDYNQALIDLPAGGLQIAKSGKYKKVVIFLTDGLSNTTRVNEIIKFANDNQITIYAVTLDMPAPQSIKDMTTQTDGQYFENITTQKEAEYTYRKLLQLAQGGDPCEIEWESSVSCVVGVTNVEMQITNLGTKATTSYVSPISSITKLEFNPTSVKFPNPEIGVKAEQKVTVTARNSDFNATNITSNNAAFTITPTSFVLNKGESTELTISYLSADSGYVYASFNFETDVCPTKYYASGGWKGVKPRIRTIKLIHPNGGEMLIAGSDTVITWEGVSPDEPVKLEYRIDENKPWITIADSIIGLSYRWKVPVTPSNQCLARVTAKVGTASFSCENQDIQICNQFWMGCNLDVDTYRNGDPIPEVTNPTQWENLTTGAWCYIVNDQAYGEIYGKLYNWYAVNDPRGLAPDGWHIPTDAEWTELTNCLGGSSVAGGKLKFPGTKEDGNGLWRSPNTGATNESGFSALPGGYCSILGGFIDIGLLGIYWSATDVSDTVAWGRTLRYDTTNIYRKSGSKVLGFSVRCVRD